MSERDNSDRARSAMLAVDAYGADTRYVAEEQHVHPDDWKRGREHHEELLGDLLGDLRHLCDRLGLDFDKLNDRGEYHHHAETIGEAVELGDGDVGDWLPVQP